MLHLLLCDALTNEHSQPQLSAAAADLVYYLSVFALSPPVCLPSGCQLPSLSLLLRYLLHLYQQHTSTSILGGGSGRARSGSSSRSGSSQHQAVQQLMASRGGKLAQGGLLLEGRDEGPLPPDVAGQQPRAVDVQVGVGRSCWLVLGVGVERCWGEGVCAARICSDGVLHTRLFHMLGFFCLLCADHQV